MLHVRVFLVATAFICCNDSMAGERGYDPAVLVEPAVASISVEILDDLVSRDCGGTSAATRSEAVIERVLFAFNDRDRPRLRDALKKMATKRAEMWIQELTSASDKGSNLETCMFKLGAVVGARATSANVIEQVSKLYGANTIERR